MTFCKGLWKEELMVSVLSLKTLVAIKGIECAFYFWKFEVWKVILTHSFPFVQKNVISYSRPRQNDGNFEWLIMFFQGNEGRDWPYYLQDWDSGDESGNCPHCEYKKSLSFLLIFLFLRSHCDPVNRTVNLKWSGGTNNWVAVAVRLGLQSMLLRL